MGGIRYWKDGRDMPDVLLALFDYPEGFNLHLRVNFVQGAPESEGLVLVGSEGVLRIGGHNVSLTRAAKPSSPPYEIGSFSLATQQEFLADYRKQYPASLVESTTLVAEETYETPEDYSDSQAHMQNFCDSVRSRKPVVEDPTFGFRAAGAALLSNVSYRGRPHGEMGSAANEDHVKELENARPRVFCAAAGIFLQRLRLPLTSVFPSRFSLCVSCARTVRVTAIPPRPF